MAGLFGNSATATPPSVNPRVQTSVQGRPRNIGAGLNRFAGNVGWYGDFKSTPASSGGKGAGGSGKGSNGSYTYSVSFMVSFGETLAAFNTIFNGNEIDFIVPPSAQVLADLQTLGITPSYGNHYGATFLLGGYAQNPWSYLVSAHPAQALAYRGEALMALANLGLGNSPSLPSFTIEGLWPINTDVPALGPDANPADWVTAFLTNPDWGIGFPAALLGNLDLYRTWCRATGMLISPVLTDQTAASSHLADIMKGTAADFRWSSGLLTVVPYGDSDVTGNGFTYSAPVTPIYDLQPEDFLPYQGSLGNAGGTTPIAVSRKDPAQVLNRVQVEYLDRSNLYNPVTIYDSDDASIIATNRLRLSDLRAHHFFCLAGAASISASLQMHREKVVVTYGFTLPPQFILPDTMDILTLPAALMGSKTGVRILEIEENADHSLNFIAEEYLGTVSSPLYDRQMSLGNARNNNADPGNVNTPVLFEPTDELGDGLFIYCAVSGIDTSLWGGCDVWVSSETGGTYTKVGSINGPARMGVTTAQLPAIAAVVSGQTIDNVNTLSVDMTESLGALASGTNVDMTSLNTRCWVGGEVIAYQTATLTGPNAYDLAPMVRGAYETPIGDHPAGTSFARLDEMIFSIPFKQNQIGLALYIKLQSFNIYGGGLQDLSILSPFVYTPVGTALASPLPNVMNIRSTYVDNNSAITWDEVADFRPVRYEIRKGDSWLEANVLGTVAHPPFATYGDGTYWIAAVSQPTAGLTVYSETAQSIVIAGSVLVDNVIASFDEEATGWLGTITGPGVIASGLFQTTASGDIAYYEVPASHVFDVSYARATRLNTMWKAVGAPTNDNVLTDPDFLNNPDILQSGASQSVEAWVEVAVAQSGSTDVFSLPDAFAPADIFAGSTGFGDWQKFAPGMYVGQFFKTRLALRSNDPGVTAFALAFANTADVPDRVDHLTGVALAAGGQTFTFKPDGSSTATAFKGGPNGSAVPLVSVSVRGATSGDTVLITGLSTSQVTIQVQNGGAGVARTIDAAIQGY